MTESNQPHPARESLERFLRGALPRPEARQVLRHLLTGCPSCRAAAGAAWPGSAAPTTAGGASGNVVPFEERLPEDRYAPAFARVAQDLGERETSFRREAVEAAHLRGALLALPPAERSSRLAADPARVRWSLVTALLDDCQQACHEDPQVAVELGELAVAAADLLDPDRYSAAAVGDLRGRARAQLANALRVTGRFRDAEEAFAAATAELERGSGDAVERCRVDSLQALLWIERKRFDEAERLLDRVEVTAARYGERHLQGIALLRKARLANRRDDNEAALDLLRRSVALIDPEEDPVLVLGAAHNFMHLLVESGRYREALDRIEQTRALHLQLGGRIDLLRFRWLEGKVYQGLGWLRQAASLYEEVRANFIADGLAFEVALVSLDLASVYSLEGADAEVRRLAEEMLPIFRSQEAHQEALAAVLFFRDAVRSRTASVRLIRELSEYLQRSRNEPGLRFHASAPAV